MVGPTLIAEFGSSPAPDWKLERWITMAAWAKADAVKVQLFRGSHFPPEEQAAKEALMFPREQYAKFVQLAHAAGLRAGASVFDDEAVHRAADLGDFVKVAAREQRNWELLTAIRLASRHGLRRIVPVYRSISDWNVLQEGDLGLGAFGDVILLTIPQYPARLSAAVVKVLQGSRAFRSMKRAWGWSSHTPGWFDSWLAAKLGAAVIEKHFALTKDDREAGHSLQPAAFRRLKERLP